MANRDMAIMRDKGKVYRFRVTVHSGINAASLAESEIDRFEAVWTFGLVVRPLSVLIP